MSNIVRIDPMADDLVLLSDILKRLPFRVAPSTVWRWRLKGVNGARLNAETIAGRLCTTESEWRRFIAESQRPSRSKDISEAAASNAQRTGSTQRRLKAAGLA